MSIGHGLALQPLLSRLTWDTGCRIERLSQLSAQPVCGRTFEDISEILHRHTALDHRIRSVAGGAAGGAACLLVLETSWVLALLCTMLYLRTIGDPTGAAVGPDDPVVLLKAGVLTTWVVHVLLRSIIGQPALGKA